MPLRALEPKSSASANSATFAFEASRLSRIIAWALSRVGGGSLQFRLRYRPQPRCLSAAAAGRGVQGASLQLQAGQLQAGILYMQTIVRLAFRRQQLTGPAHYLFKHGDAKGSPQALALLVAYPLIAGTQDGDQRMCEAGNLALQQSQ